MPRDGARQVNNPARVPDTLAAIDGPQAGAPRIIHPVAVAVGTKEQHMYQRAESEPFVVPEDGTYTDNRGNPIALTKGHRLSVGRAMQFPAFRERLAGRRASGITAARAQSAAPENRVEPAPQTPEDGDTAPENRGDDEELTPQQKAARTRAANQAAKAEAETADETADDAAEPDAEADEDAE